MNRAWLPFTALPTLALVFAAACGGGSDASDGTSGAITNADGSADAKADASTNANADASANGDASANADANGDANAEVDAAPLSSLACLGASAAMTLNHGLPYTSVAVGNPAASGLFLVDFATTRSTIDLGALPSVSAQATGCNPALLGQACSFPAFDFFGPWGQVTLTTDDESFVTGVRQAGIVGTDFTSDVAVTIDYATPTLRRAISGTLCTDAALAAAGFTALSCAGFFAKDTTTLKPLTDVVSTAAAGSHVPNVPTVTLRVATTTAVVQLDTGFSDALVPFSVNVNVAFYNAIAAATPAALVRNMSKDLVLTTCVGVDENVEAYDLAAGTSVAFVNGTGQDAGKTSAATIFVKKTPAAASSCGGIGTWTVPAAQVGASFFGGRAWVFDPDTSRVWMR